MTDNTEKKVITILLSQHKKLLRDSKILELLYAGGVENWEWFSESLEKLEDDDE